MKKTLLGTTALVSAGLVAGPALASDPLTVTVGGTVTAGFYAIDHDDFGAVGFNDTAVKLVARNIDINAEGTLDNGMVAGVTATLSLGDDWNYHFNNDATFRELFAYLEGGFGRFEIGGTDGAAFKMHYTSPWFVPGNGVDSPNILNVNTVNSSIATLTALASTPFFRNSTFSLMAADANKVTYFTPRFAGFQLGLSYTPDVTYNGPNPNGLGVAASGAVVNDVVEVALNYAGSFGSVDLGADGFYVTGDAPTATNGDPEELGFGLNLGFGGFTLGGSWYQSEDLAVTSVVLPSASGLEEEVWTAGLSYSTGPWTVGVAYLTDELSTPGYSAEIETWQTGGGYNLGSGVDVGLDLQMSDVDYGAAGSYDSMSGGLVLSVSF
ncbi:porin [Parvibaculum sp.]|jgi:predicted porin|uniref:porin n=1 Tax=Parvibaculum sp. TaxID=2024848 RepID=UPI001B252FEB|nr:porin [Parvibaculum sp.]MBO6635456.1 porin [Parvibaculum sp.]MBO6677440.1 porin [Parvibaculum sp.]MBO6686208.1 porin [Parvibaculum sp.]MBO6906326.1 porin [Parvibaculum sp.]